MKLRAPLLDRYDNKILALHYEYVTGSIWNNGDIEYYRERITRHSGKVLEIGCGSGRVTLPLARAGVNIVGVDVAREMVEIAKKKILSENMNILLHVADGALFDDGHI